VKLNGDKLKHVNTFYDSIEKDDPTVEVFGGMGINDRPRFFRYVVIFRLSEFT